MTQITSRTSSVLVDLLWTQTILIATLLANILILISLLIYGIMVQKYGATYKANISR